MVGSKAIACSGLAAAPKADWAAAQQSLSVSAVSVAPALKWLGMLRFETALSNTSKSILFALLGVGCVGASIVAKDGADTNFTQHLPSNRTPVAEGFVSSLSCSSTRPASVGFAVRAWVLGLLMHGAIVQRHSLTFYGGSFCEVDTWN